MTLASAAAALVAGALAVSVVAAQVPASAPDPLIKENATVKVSDHVFVIPDNNVPLVPNVGIIVGNTATLVVDTGLGPKNGQAVLREVAKVSRNTTLYVVSTSFSPEHALGESAFPATAKVIRARAQQQDIDEFGLKMADAFSLASPAARALLQGAQFRRGDTFFAREYALDLGGISVQVSWIGPTYTRGDTSVFVNGDRVLFSGDVVLNRAFLPFASPYSSVRVWLSSFDRLDALAPTRVVPSHGAMGDGTLIGQDRGYLETLQARVAMLKGQGYSADEAGPIVTTEMRATYPDWTAPARVSQAVATVFPELQQ
jgi:glyoxylase-like metal-dependent hydrolase (beta-lactamase superfamily II)